MNKTRAKLLKISIAVLAIFTLITGPLSIPTKAASVGPIIFSEPEFPVGTIVNGLVVNTLNGTPIDPLSFGYTVGGAPSTDASINFGPPIQTYVDPPGIEGGTAGTLSIDFGTDVGSVVFGFAMSCLTPSPTISPGATLMAYDSGGGFVGMTSADALDTGFSYVENRVSFASATPFRSIDITFGTTCARFLVPSPFPWAGSTDHRGVEGSQNTSRGSQ